MFIVEVLQPPQGGQEATAGIGSSHKHMGTAPMKEGRGPTTSSYYVKVFVCCHTAPSRLSQQHGILSELPNKVEASGVGR